MRWEDKERSANVEDRRGGGGGKGKVVIGGVGTVVLVIIGLIVGIEPKKVVETTQAINQKAAESQGTDAPAKDGEKPETDPEEDRLADFVSVVLADTETTWDEIFKKQGKTYKEPKLVLFDDAVASACGRQTAAVGPFYCPGDMKAYIDLQFYEDLHKKYGAPGDFAQAYVIAHEVGHHVQNLMGTSMEVHKKQRGLPKEEANKLSVKLELQADCYAGIWAHHAKAKRDMLEKGDVEEGLQAATAIGDDTLQKRATGRVMPESFTHGSAAQRVRWFKMGFEHGDVEKCDTFKAETL